MSSFHFSFEDDLPEELLLKHIRPRAYQKVKLGDVQKGDLIMANYNLENPEERGHWYDCKVSIEYFVSVLVTFHCCCSLFTNIS